MCCCTLLVLFYVILWCLSLYCVAFMLLCYVVFSRYCNSSSKINEQITGQPISTHTIFAPHNITTHDFTWNCIHNLPLQTLNDPVSDTIPKNYQTSPKKSQPSGCPITRELYTHFYTKNSMIRNSLYLSNRKAIMDLKQIAGTLIVQ